MQGQRLIEPLSGHRIFRGFGAWILFLAIGWSFIPGCATEKWSPSKSPVDKGDDSTKPKLAKTPETVADQQPIPKGQPPTGEPAASTDEAIPTAQAPALEAPNQAPAGSVAYVVLDAREPRRSEARLSKALKRSLHGKVTKLATDAEATAFGMAIIANKAATFPDAWRSYQHVVVLQNSAPVEASDDKRYPGGSGFLALFRSPNVEPLLLEQGGHLWPDSYEDVSTIINTLMKENTR